MTRGCGLQTPSEPPRATDLSPLGREFAAGYSLSSNEAVSGDAGTARVHVEQLRNFRHVKTAGVRRRCFFSCAAFHPKVERRTWRRVYSQYPETELTKICGDEMYADL